VPRENPRYLNATDEVNALLGLARTHFKRTGEKKKKPPSY